MPLKRFNAENLRCLTSDRMLKEAYHTSVCQASLKTNPQQWNKPNGKHYRNQSARRRPKFCTPSAIVLPTDLMPSQADFTIFLV